MPEIEQEHYREKFYTSTELAKLWHVSPDTIRRLFRQELGVLQLKNEKSPARPYVTLRIPESAVRRVYERFAVSAQGQLPAGTVVAGGGAAMANLLRSRGHGSR